MQGETWRRILRRVLGAVFAAAGIWVFFRFGFRWLGPFLLALGTAAALEKTVMLLTEKFHWKRGFASASCTLLFFAVLVLAVWIMLRRGIVALEKLAGELPQMLQSLWQKADEFRGKADGLMRGVPGEIRAALDSAIEGFGVKLEEIPGRLAEKLAKGAAGFAGALPGTVLFLVTYAAGAFFIGMNYPAVRSFLGRQLPEKCRKILSGMKGEAFTAVTAWFSAQLRLVTVTFLVMTAGFWLLRIEYAALLALFVAVVDALPVLGTGVVLLPWAGVELLLGAPVRALALALLYAIAALVRGFLEPRLIGEKAGVHPAASLFAMYSGFCIAGVGGMILFPLALLVIKQLSDKGYVHLWR